ncbi:hypothetical protein [Streptomyces sp. NPDC008240]|uniref:hypothetical protein n=1 Tax=Streptomyces sp. NPDC008240 TaxID=3364822 RepID=UPI0036E63E00
MSIATGISIAYGLVYGLLALAIWRVRRPRRPALEARIAAARERTAPAPTAAVRETEPGINLADHDACELLWSMPARHPGLDRLRQAIRDEQKKGEQA